MLADMPHQVLNARNDEREAAIVARAGERGAVTISTNMAGRGTDIRLGEGVAELGGLYVIGTNKHESRRIDNQLRGRAGRQGDPGCSRFFVSLEDDLMVKYAGARSGAGTRSGHGAAVWWKVSIWMSACSCRGTNCPSRASGIRIHAYRQAILEGKTACESELGTPGLAAHHRRSVGRLSGAGGGIPRRYAVARFWPWPA